MKAFPITFSKQVGVYARYERDTNQVLLKTSFYYLCPPGAAVAECSDELEWKWSTQNACSSVISSGTFESYHRVSGVVSLKKKVSVDPTTVPKSLCSSVKHVQKTLAVSLDELECSPALLHASGSLDSSSQVVIDDPSTTSTPFRKRCAKHCVPGQPIHPENEDLCLWCDRATQGNALFPETHGPAVEDICGS